MLYVNVKGVVTTPGKQTATILTGVFIVVIVAAIILAMAPERRRAADGIRHGSGGPHVNGGNGGWRGRLPPGSP